MDSLTQAVVGAVVGEIILGRKLGWRGAALGAFFGTLPDLDILVKPLLSAAEQIRWHRGLSHSILIMIIASLLLAKPLARRYTERGVTAKEMGWMVFWVWSTHSLVDCFTTYGTQIFEPFSDIRVAMNLFFIVDPLFTLPMLIGLILVFRTDASHWQERRRIMRKSIFVSCLYLVFAFGMQTIATRNIDADLVKHHPEAKLVAVAPSSFNTILWRGLIETDDGYYLTYWSPFDDDEPSYEFFAKRRELAQTYEGGEVLETLKWFTRGHWVARHDEDGNVVIIDMRFTEIRDPDFGTSMPIFQWHLSRSANGETQAPMYSRRDLNFPAAIALVWKRMWGNRTVWEGLKEF